MASWPKGAFVARIVGDKWEAPFFLDGEEYVFFRDDRDAEAGDIVAAFGPNHQRVVSRLIEVDGELELEGIGPLAAGWVVLGVKMSDDDLRAACA